MELTEAGAHMDTVNVHGETPFEAATTGKWYEVTKAKFLDNPLKITLLILLLVMFLSQNPKIYLYLYNIKNCLYWCETRCFNGMYV
jgi:hypothetical protein